MEPHTLIPDTPIDLEIDLGLRQAPGPALTMQEESLQFKHQWSALVLVSFLPVLPPSLRHSNLAWQGQGWQRHADVAGEDFGEQIDGLLMQGAVVGQDMRAAEI